MQQSLSVQARIDDVELLLALFGRSSSPPLFVELARGGEQARELSRVGPVGQLHPGGRRSAQVDGNPLFSFLGLWELVA